MLLNIMSYIMIAYLMLLVVLFNAVCLHDAYFFAIDLANAFYFHTLSCVIDTFTHPISA